MSALDELVKIIEEKKFFQRNKRSVRTKAKAFLLYQNGCSYKETADGDESQKIFIAIKTYEAYWGWDSP